ncbi:hypothetical protein QR665_13935 [Acinetobacter gerneri]|uniref:hypothetical protein n=1 Tax=Acinetobacter gerneri TaxID=202952 RepID=UPI002935D8A3|nr:hypothetical protein [Acinetobacter gerneri]MDV2440562.1 hypothetical protein [Acinetobacter gerneri]
MNPFFEIKYLALNWYDQKTLTKVTESLVSLDVEYDEEYDLFRAETTIYPKVEGVKRGLLGIRFLNQKSDIPYIEMPNGVKNYLTSIIDPETNLIWWIAKDQWIKEHKQWSSIAPNIVGMVRFILQGKLCDLAINGSDFTLDQLDQYLRTFKDDLWELILDESSAVQAKARSSQTIGIGENAVDCIANLVDHAQKVLKNPKVELREIQTSKPRKEVKPINRTFMELATKTNQRFLTSRATEPSYNVAENRYVLFALERCYRIIKQIVILANNKRQRFQHMVKKLQSQHDAFKNYVRVDRDLVVSDLKIINERRYLHFWQQKLDEEIRNSQLNLIHIAYENDYFFEIQGYTKDQNTNEINGFFVLVWDGYNWVKPKNKSGILRFFAELNGLINILQFGMKLKINGDFRWRETDGSVQFILSDIHKIELLDCEELHKARKVYEEEKQSIKELADKNWLKPLTKNELEEQEKEKVALRNRINFYNESQKLCAFVFEKVEPKFRLLKSIINQMKILGVKTSSYFPNSMTFVQNPNYQGVHNNYKVLRDVMNLQDENLLISLEEIDEIGIVNMPLLYERWTLIQIILVLKNVFRFVPIDDWKYKIIDAVKTNREGISVTLLNEKAKRYIRIWYEKKLPNNRKPDFMLDLFWYAENDSEKINRQLKRFVLDAKFYDKSTFVREGGMMSKINELYELKNYSEDGQNPVFLINPCKNLIDHRVTAQEWGKYSYIGEMDSHDKGAVFLNPIDRNLYNDELQRLLGMFLQYKLEDSETNPHSDKTSAVPICIRCGSSHIENLPKTSGYYDKDGVWKKRTQRSVWMQCVECEQMQVYNHCSSKKHNHRLIKNGLYWSYHSVRALELFNMKCPECGEWGGW